MRVAHYLIRGRSGLFYFRLRVPPDLCAGVGVRVIKRATGTRCPRVALALAVDWAGRYAQTFAALRRGDAMTKPPSIEDILSGRSGTGGDIRTWTTDEMEVGPSGVRFKGLNIADDADQARFNTFLKSVAVMPPEGGTPRSEARRKQEPEKTEENGFISFDGGKEKWSQILPVKTPANRKTKRAKMKALEDVQAVFDTFPKLIRPV